MYRARRGEMRNADAGSKKRRCWMRNMEKRKASMDPRASERGWQKKERSGRRKGSLHKLNFKLGLPPISSPKAH
jgi:hypothetical protein